MLQKATKKFMRQVRRSTPEAAAAASRVWSKARRVTLVLAGFGAIDYGVFQINTIAGWITGGVLVLCLEALSESSDDEAGDA